MKGAMEFTSGGYEEAAKKFDNRCVMLHLRCESSQQCGISGNPPWYNAPVALRQQHVYCMFAIM